LFILNKLDIEQLFYSQDDFMNFSYLHSDR